MIISHMIILIHQWPWRFPKSQISQAFIGVDVKTGQERLFVEATGALETATVFMAGCWMNMLSLTMISYKPINNSIWVDIFTWYLYDIYMIVSHDSYMIFIWYLYDIYWELLSYQWPFQEPRLEVPTIYKAYFSGLCKGISPENMALYGTVPPF